MTTNIVRHRYEPYAEDGLPATCATTFPGALPCGLNQYASFHYNDGDHPYSGGGDGAGRGCTWPLQEGEEPGRACGLGASDMAHANAAEEAGREERNEGGVWRHGFVTVPDEAGVRVDDRPRTLADKLAQSFQGLGEGMYPSPRPAADPEPMYSPAAEDFLSARPVGITGWPVRQWWFDGNAGAVARTDHEMDVEETLSSLWSTGAAYDHYVWWHNGGRVVRVIWGELLGLDAEAVAARMSTS